MIWMATALAAPSCDKMTEPEIAEVTDWLAAVVAPIRKGGAPTPDNVSFAQTLHAEDRLCTPTDRYHAAMILAYGFDKPLTEAGYELAKVSMAEGTAGAPQLVASIFDRYLVVRGKPQRYATMTGANPNGSACMFPLDPASDEERATYGLGPLEARYVEFSTGAGYGGLTTYSELGQSQAICPMAGGGKKLKATGGSARSLGGARTLQITGAAVTLNGVAIAAAGGGLTAVLASQPPCTTPEEPNQCGLVRGLGVVAGIGAAVTSVPFLAAGVPMWIVGSSKVRRAKRARESVTAQLSPTIDRPGLRLSGTW